MATASLIVDIILIAAAIWMVLSVRDLGGVVGRTLNLIVAGTIILGIAHLQATLTGRFIELGPGVNSFIHRVVVLVGPGEEEERQYH